MVISCAVLPMAFLSRNLEVKGYDTRNVKSFLSSRKGKDLNLKDQINILNLINTRKAYITRIPGHVWLFLQVWYSSMVIDFSVLLYNFDSCSKVWYSSMVIDFSVLLYNFNPCSKKFNQIQKMISLCWCNSDVTINAELPLESCLFSGLWSKRKNGRKLN